MLLRLKNMHEKVGYSNEVWVSIFIPNSLFKYSRESVLVFFKKANVDYF